MSTTITPSISDRVFAVLQQDDAGGLTEVLHDGFGAVTKPQTEYESDLAEFGMLFGICFALCREEDPWEAHKDAAERAMEHARIVQARWGGAIAFRPDDSTIAEAAQALFTLLDENDRKLYENDRPAYDAVWALKNAIEGTRA